MQQQILILDQTGITGGFIKDVIPNYNMNYWISQDWILKRTESCFKVLDILHNKVNNIKAKWIPQVVR